MMLLIDMTRKEKWWTTMILQVKMKGGEWRWSMVDNKDDGRRKWLVYGGVAGEDEISKKKMINY